MSEDEQIETDTVVQSSEQLFPARLRNMDRWGVWKLEVSEDDNRKIPRAPQNRDANAFASYKEEENWMSFEEAQSYDEKLPSMNGVYFPTLNGDGLMLLDFDDVRNPVTGEVLPIVKEWVERVGGFAQISQSGTGIHAIVEGQLPDNMKSMVIDLPGHDEAELEVYDGDRFIAMTGDRLDCSDPVVREAQDFVDFLVEEYGDDAITKESGERGEEWEPDSTREEIEALDSTAEMEDIYDAIKHTTVRDIRLKSEKTEGSPSGRMSFDPSWEHSDSGTRLGYEDGAWIYRKGNHGLDALQVVALEEGILTRPDEYPTGREFWEAVQKLRERGAPIPEFDEPDDEPDVVAILPETPPTNEWDWQSASTGISRDDMPSMKEARERLSDEMDEIWEGTDNKLISALPGLGKSSGAIRSCASTGEKTTIYTARHDLYGQYRAWAEDQNLTYYTLPSMPRDCPTAAGEHGDEWQDRVLDWYNRGATPKAIHAHAENAMGRPLPCQEHGQCPYSAKWDFDADDFDVLIGHYKHAYKENTHAGRVAVFDEFPEGSYSTTMTGPQFKGSVTRYLQDEDDIPVDDFAGLVARRNDPDVVEAVKEHFDGDLETDPEGVVYNEDAHANAPIAIYALISTKDLGNGYEFSRLPNGDRAVIKRGDLTVHTLHTPDLTYASPVVALDGTPTTEMWRMVLDARMSKTQPLDTEERRHYVANTLGMNIVQTTTAIKPYSSGKWVTDGGMKKDEALLEAIGSAYDEKPALISTLSAMNRYEEAGLLSHTSAYEHYGNLKGSNQFADTRLGVIIGSQHYGDDYIKRWGAYRGAAIEDNGERGFDRSYGAFGDQILTHMREHETLQALLRFGRDGGGATVFVHTNTLPDWVPLSGRGATINVWSDGMLEVVRAVQHASEWTTSEIAEACDVSRRQVLEHLKTLAGIGYVSQGGDGNGYIWTDAGVEEASDVGHVELDDVGFAELSEEEVREGSRKVVITWDFALQGSDPPSPEQQQSEEADADQTRLTDGGSADGPPPG